MQRCPCSATCYSNRVIYYYQLIIFLKMISVKKHSFFNLVVKWIATLGILGVVSYPIIIHPMLDPSSYKEMQKVGRKGLIQENIQPGNMKVWSDPFQSKSDK